MSERARVPDDSPNGEPLYLIACADATLRVRERSERNNCRASRGRVVVLGGSSYERIEAGQRLGELDPEQALVYKVFAAFSDPRLPSRYRGDDTGTSGTTAVRDARAEIASLSPAARAQVEPFLLPPIYAGSFADPASAARAGASRHGTTAQDFGSCRVMLEGWNYVDTANGGARIWWRETQSADEQLAHALANELTTTIWPRLTGLLGRQPLSDAGERCNGLGPQLDVYIYPLNRSTTAPYGDCIGTPSYVVIDPEETRSTLAHEFMHVMQFTFPEKPPCGQWASIDDATATWAENAVYPTDQEEQAWPEAIVDRNYVFGKGEGYPGWAFLFSVTHRVGDAVIPGLYVAAKDHNPFAALGAQLPGNPGGYEEHWPAFARYAWNRPLPDALTQSFFRWDSWDVRPDVPVLVLGGGVREMPMGFELTGLGKHYTHMKFADPDVRRVRFRDPAPAGVDPGLRTYAFFKLADGKWQGEDWTGLREREFCRDDPEEDVREAVVINTSSTQPDGENGTEIVASSEKPRLELREECDSGLPRRFRGSLSGVLTRTGDEHEYRATWSASDVVFVADTSIPDEVVRAGSVRYRLESGTVHWQFSDRYPYYSQGSFLGYCNAFGETVGDMSDSVGGIDIHRVGKRWFYRGFAIGGADATVTRQCPPDEPPEETDGGTGEVTWWWSGPEEPGEGPRVAGKLKRFRPGGPLAGTATSDYYGEEEPYSWEWNLVPAD